MSHITSRSAGPVVHMSCTEVPSGPREAHFWGEDSIDVWNNHERCRMRLGTRDLEGAWERYIKDHCIELKNKRDSETGIGIAELHGHEAAGSSLSNQLIPFLQAAANQGCSCLF